MSESIVVEMMSRPVLLWRCLHGGPLTAESLEHTDGTGDPPWAALRARNLPVLERLTDVYGACAVTARAGGSLIGHLRFYPKAVRVMAEPGLGLCLQQEFPCGPAGDFAGRVFPPLADLADKTLLVHCLMLAPEEEGGESYRRRGIGTLMARALLNWADAAGWTAIESTAYEPLPVIYARSGQTGRGFWEALGFRLVRTEREPYLEAESDFVRRMREEAARMGLDPARLANRYIMRLDFG
jgi:GNAT superfamily N-acetyltransferase